VLTFSSSVAVADATAGNTVMAATASAIIRPNARTNTAQLAVGDELTMANLLDAVSTLRLNAVPEIDGVFNCYLDPVSARQLFADNDFRQLFQGATSANQVFKKGILNMLLGTLAAMATSTVAYWVGSSSGSAQKNDMLYRSTPPAPAVVSKGK
jgi:hypothetical protein